MADSDWGRVKRDIVLEHLRNCLGHGSVADMLEDLEDGIRQQVNISRMQLSEMYGWGKQDLEFQSPQSGVLLIVSR